MSQKPPSYYQNNDNNSPTKEIWATSGIYDQQSYGATQYAADMPNTGANTGINTKIPVFLSPPLVDTDSALLSTPQNTFSSGNYFIDDMQIFNPYRHHVGSIQFDPQSFLIATVNFFNVYSIKYRS